MGLLDGRTAVVTGSASGMGRGVARAFAAEGAVLGLLDTNASGLDEAAGEIGTAGGRALALPTDVGDEAAMRAAFDRVVDAFGPVEILVNCAAIDPVDPIGAITPAQWDAVVRVNLRSMFLGARAVIPGMRARGWGRIINFASQLGHKGAPLKAHYAAAKGGVIAFTRSLAREVAADGITVNAVCPGPIDTPMMRAVPQDWLDRKLAEVPARRAGRVDEVVPTVLMLASEAGSYYVGATLNMNGGDVMV